MTHEGIPHLITLRVADFLGTPPGDRFTTRCHRCFSEVLVSPSSPYWTKQLIVTCTHCARILGRGPVVSEPLTEAQRMDIARHTGLHGDLIDRFLEEVVIPDIFGREDIE